MLEDYEDDQVIKVVYRMVSGPVEATVLRSDLWVDDGDNTDVFLQTCLHWTDVPSKVVPPTFLDNQSVLNSASKFTKDDILSLIGAINDHADGNNFGVDAQGLVHALETLFINTPNLDKQRYTAMIIRQELSYTDYGGVCEGDL